MELNHRLKSCSLSPYHLATALLAYVFVDGVLLQELLLQEGYAAVRYVKKPNNTLEDELRDIQTDAEKEGFNVWSLEGYFDNNRFNENYNN